MAYFGILVCIGAALYSVAQTVVALMNGTPLAALTAGGLAVFFWGMVAALAITLLASAEGHADSSSTGTTVRVHPAIAWSYGVALLGGIVGSASYLVFVARGVVELPLGAPGGGGITRYLMAALLAISAISFVALLRSREPGCLQVGVEGIKHADMFRTRTARWDDIVAITDAAKKKARNPIVFAVANGEQVVVPNADRYASSGAALYWMARHYWRHPDNRDELTDGRALDRLRNERFDPN
jgi:hypothetical protein